MEPPSRDNEAPFDQRFDEIAPSHRWCDTSTTAAKSLMWITVLASRRSSFDAQAARIRRDPASIMFALSRTVILDHREGTAVLVSSALFLSGAFMLIGLFG